MVLVKLLRAVRMPRLRAQVRLRTLLLAVVATAILLGVGIEVFLRGPAWRARVRHRDVVAALDREAGFWQRQAEEADRSEDWRSPFRAEIHRAAEWYAKQGRRLRHAGRFRPDDEWSRLDEQRMRDRALIQQIRVSLEVWRRAHPSDELAGLKWPPSR